MTIIITINREFQYDFEYNYHTQNMGSVDYDYLLQSTVSSNMTLSMNMAVFGKHDIIKRVNIVVTMENTMILT